jgi:4-amino-4-deoxy-L-arabinose transferase-like glycosyltransferase
LVLALFAAIVLAPLLYLPGFLFARAMLGVAQPPDLLERHYERVVVGALLNGWLAFTLAELGIFSAWLHLLLLLAICAGCAARAQWRGALHFPRSPLGIVARIRPTGMAAATTAARGAGTAAATEGPPYSGRWSAVAAHWDVVAFAAVGVLFAVLVARPFEVVLGVRDAGVYSNIGFAIVRTGGIVQHDELVAQIGRDQSADDPELRAAAAQAETNFLGVQHPDRTIATRLRAAGFYINAGELERGRVVPQFFHLYPAWIGLLAALLGLRGGLLATGLLGFLGVWSVGMLGRRLAGRWVGLLAMLFLALNGVQVWFSRYSTSEATVQFLTFAGLYAFAVMMTDDRIEDRGSKIEDRRVRTIEDRSSILDPRSSIFGGRRGFAALLAGLAFGQVALARADFGLVIAPLAAYLFYIWLTRRWTRIYTLLAGGLGVMLLQAMLHIAFIARAYFFDTFYARLQDYALTALAALPFLTPTLRTLYLSTAHSKIGIRLGPGQYLWNWQRIAIEAAIVLLVIGGILALRRWGQPLIAAGERVARRWAGPLLLASALGIVALAAYGYLVRPQILTPERLVETPSCLSSAQFRQPSAACLALQGYIGAPIAPPAYPNRVAYLLDALPKWIQGKSVPPIEDSLFVADNASASEKFGIAQANLVRVGWYLSPLGIVLGVVGFALWWRRGMSRAAWLFLAIGLIETVFWVRQSYGTSDQSYIYILRRYMPQVYPAFCLGIAYALICIADCRSQITDWRAENREPEQGDEETRRQTNIAVVGGRWSVVAAAALGLALIGFLAVTNRGIYRHVEYGGALAQVESIAARFGPRDVLLLHSGSRDEPDLLATPLRFAFGVDAFTIKSSQPEHYAPQLARYIRRWQEQGRTVYIIFGASGGFGLPGSRYTPAGRMTLQHLEEFEQLTDQKPNNVQDFNLDFAIYRLEAGDSVASAAPTAVAVDDYAAQLRGLYRPERIAGVELAWTKGDALLRLPWPRDGGPQKVVVRLAGGVRPASVGPGRACLEFWPATDVGFEPPPTLLGGLGCFDLQAQMMDYVLTIDPHAYPDHASGAILLRILSDTWTPAKADPAQIDRRALGIQFGGLTMTP